MGDRNKVVGINRHVGNVDTDGAVRNISISPIQSRFDGGAAQDGVHADQSSSVLTMITLLGVP